MTERWPEIILNTPFEELKAIHKRIWDECIEEYNGRHKPKTPYNSNCVACEVAFLRFKKNGPFMCHYCPMFDEDSMCIISGSLFERWRYATNRVDKIRFAQQIRDYKWREENEG